MYNPRRPCTVVKWYGFVLEVPIDVQYEIISFPHPVENSQDMGNSDYVTQLESKESTDADRVWMERIVERLSCTIIPPPLLYVSIDGIKDGTLGGVSVTQLERGHRVRPTTAAWCGTTCLQPRGRLSDHESLNAAPERPGALGDHSIQQPSHDRVALVDPCLN